MYLENLALKNFRNFSQEIVSFSPDVNIFLGANAQGKTNLLEAIYFLGLTRSHRTSNDKELIKFDEKFAVLNGNLRKNSGQILTNLRLNLSSKGKTAFINRLEQKKLSRYVGEMNAILFSPEDLSLVKGGPGLRRKFMDLEFSQINREYLYFSTQYQKVLHQKNNYLKQLALGKTKDKVFLNVLSEQLATIAGEIIWRRINYLKRLNSYAQVAHQAISNAQEKLEIVYQPSINEILDDDSVENIVDKVKAQFKKLEQSELKSGLTQVGPHRDDIYFLINGKNAREYGSQGQQRTVALSLKLAEIQFIYELTGEYPILLLDDVMSELDHTRQSKLLNYIHGKTQTFITTTDLEGISWEKIKQPRIFKLNSGKISKEEN
ncbi:DNA replication/repair protein RecF [Lactobacillus sp. PV037]|uniref:DNA replication/repair protein RecF n=1 Tax=unclassified Lactobacillus TaxID=2620435 RepID=UPI0022408BDB|nr:MULTISPECIES: DNA replication/repair protein RecF [unclassified Lactobacillus]QNQ81597.1 DNA replication/repair protein RecF [Lactobacillus sp. PV012]QNQ84356.1 DNA replication/repair protein RecF [Lactobacillus sp. PV037]